MVFRKKHLIQEFSVITYVVTCILIQVMTCASKVIKVSSTEIKCDSPFRLKIFSLAARVKLSCATLGAQP